jgi:hypothetical protein
MKSAGFAALKLNKTLGQTFGLRSVEAPNDLGKRCTQRGFGRP